MLPPKTMCIPPLLYIATFVRRTIKSILVSLVITFIPYPFSPDNLNSLILYRLMTCLLLMYFYHKVMSDALSVNEKYKKYLG